MIRIGKLIVLRIAGVSLEIGCEGHAMGVMRSDGVYGDFMPPVGALEGHDRAGRIPVDVTVGGLGEPAHDFVRMFDSDGAWTMYGRGEERLFLVGGSRGGGPVFSASFGASFGVNGGGVHITCAREAVQPGGGVCNPVMYPMDQTLMMYVLGTTGGLILHAAGAIIRGRAYVFAGVSGAGKSTLSGMLAKWGGRGNRPLLLSDDRMIVRETAGGGFEAWGTPWSGDARVGLNAGAPLGGILFIDRHGPVPGLRRLQRRDALARFAKVASIPWYDRAVIGPACATLDRLIQWAPSYEFTFTRDASSIGMLYDHLG